MTDALPDWVKEIRPHQTKAVEEIVRAFEDVDVVYVDAPTGSGKTLIAELTRRALKVRNCLYVCSDKSLQDQFARDFPYAKVLKGRSNYPTLLDPQKTAADCMAVSMEDACWYCDTGKPGCPYEIARSAALHAPLAVTNTSYMLTEANYVGRFSGRDLMVVDEADVLEKVMMGFVEFRTPRRYLELVKMEPPKKGARKTTIVKWMEDYHEALGPAVAREKDIVRQRNLSSHRSAVERTKMELVRDVERAAANDSEDKGVWLRDYDDKEAVLILRPVTVNKHGGRYLWRHAKKFLIMSATIISSDEMSESLGLPMDYATVTVPMTFPVANRPIIMAPVANVVYKEMDQAVPKLVTAVKAILDKHAGERVLVHTVSYATTKRLMEGVKGAGTDRVLVTYTSGMDRESSLARYKRTPGAVLFAPSMERGVDLPGDLCRVQIIAKVPFPSLGDRQVSARTHLPGGQVWYTVQTVRDVVQMAGRGVRNEEDWATTYILDAQFGRNLWGKWKHLFPGWFSEAVDTKQDVRWLRG